MNDKLKTIISIFFPNICPFCLKRIGHNKFYCGCVEIPEKTFKRYAVGGYPCESVFIYKGEYAEAIKKMKFHEYPQFAESLAWFIYNSAKLDCDVITFVPMFKDRVRERGYDQAELLARELSNLSSIPCETLLLKIKDNREQHKCSASERKTNVKGVYKAVNSDKIKGKRVLVVDDIITTGNTIGECCRMLEKAKAGKITCATVCAKID